MEAITHDDGRRFEVLAAITGIGAATVFLGAFGQILAFNWISSGYGDNRFRWDVVFQNGSPSANVLPAGLLALALALVLLSPGPTIGRLGSQVLQGLRLTGAVVSLCALFATEELLRRASTLELGLSPGPYAPGTSLPKQFLLRVSIAAPFLAAAAMAACVAWVSQRTLRDLPLESGPRADGESDDLAAPSAEAADGPTNL